MVTDINIGGIEVSLRTSGATVELAGFYDRYPSRGLEPQLTINATLIEGFEVGRSQGPNHPGFEICATQEAIQMSRLDAEGIVGFGKGRVEADFQCSTCPNSLEAIIRIGASIALPRQGALILHSSAVADARGAHVFSGVSGAGKSTIAAMLDDATPVQKLSDELIIVFKREGSWWTAVSPFIGGQGLPHGAEAKLSSINLLEQHPTHHRELVPTHVAMGELCRHVLTYAQDGHTRQCVLDLVADLVESVPCYRLQFAKNASVAEVLGITC